MTKLIVLLLSALTLSACVPLVPPPPPRLAAQTPEMSTPTPMGLAFNDAAGRAAPGAPARAVK